MAPLACLTSCNCTLRWTFCIVLDKTNTLVLPNKSFVQCSAGARTCHAGSPRISPLATLVGQPSRHRHGKLLFLVFAALWRLHRLRWRQRNRCASSGPIQQRWSCRGRVQLDVTAWPRHHCFSRSASLAARRVYALAPRCGPSLPCGTRHACPLLFLAPHSRFSWSC